MKNSVRVATVALLALSPALVAGAANAAVNAGNPDRPSFIPGHPTPNMVIPGVPAPEVTSTVEFTAEPIIDGPNGAVKITVEHGSLHHSDSGVTVKDRAGKVVETIPSSAGQAEFLSDTAVIISHDREPGTPITRDICEFGHGANGLCREKTSHANPLGGFAGKPSAADAEAAGNVTRVLAYLLGTH